LSPPGGGNGNGRRVGGTLAGGSGINLYKIKISSSVLVSKYIKGDMNIIKQLEMQIEFQLWPYTEHWTRFLIEPGR
jgi:hypothetical protein